MKSILTNKHYRRYSNISRYSSFPVYYNTEDNKYVTGITSNLQVENIPYTAHKVKTGDTLDTLALKYYNNSAHYWIIADFNRLQDVYGSLDVGTILKIPSLSAIKFEV